MKYNSSEIKLILKTNRSKISKVLKAIGSDTWLSSVSEEHTNLVEFIHGLEQWIEMTLNNPSWSLPDEQGDTLDQKLDSVFVYAFQNLIEKKAGNEDGLNVSCSNKARVLADIGTPGIHRGMGSSINLFADFARTHPSHLEHILPSLVENTPFLTPDEFLHFVLADSEAKFWLSRSEHLVPIFSLVSDKRKAISLVNEQNIDLPPELRCLIEKETLELDLETKHCPAQAKARVKI